MAPRQLRLPIKCNLIAGQLASGKTSLILRLLSTKPKDEVWAILVNEAGAVGIDQALLSGATTTSANDDVESGTPATGSTAIKMLGGGCLCCTLSSVTSAALVQLIRTSKPDRLIIEPSGLAHPKALLKMLKGPHLATALDLQPIVCLVDLSTFTFQEDSTFMAQEDSNFMAQIALADVLIGTKADLIGQQQLDHFREWVVKLHPKPNKIMELSNSSEINIEDISVDPIKEEGKEIETADDQISSLFAGSLVFKKEEENMSLPLLTNKTKKVWLSNAPNSEGSPLEEQLVPLPSQPLRRELTVAPGGTSTCGWIFHKNDIFDSGKVESFVARALPNILRLKGIFQVEKGKWMLVSIGSGSNSSQIQNNNKSDGGDGAATSLLQPLVGTYQDSRVEMIVGSEHVAHAIEDTQLAEALRNKDWEKIENLLVELLVVPP